jgi:hypothetical protein
MTFEMLIWFLVPLILGVVPCSFRCIIHRPNGKTVIYHLEIQTLFWHLQLTKQPEGIQDIKLRIAITDRIWPVIWVLLRWFRDRQG